MKALLLLPIACIIYLQGLSQNPTDSFATSSSVSSQHLSTKMLIRALILKGDSALSKGDLPLAEKEYKKSYALIEIALREKNSHRISTYNETIFDPIDRLGYLYILTNNLTKAEFYFEISRKLRDVHLPKKSLFRVPPLVGLGEVYFQKGEYKRAKEKLDQAEKIFNSSVTGWYNYDHYGKSIYKPKFEIALRERNYKDAKRYLSRLSSGATVTTDKNVQANIPRVFDMRARYYLHKGDYYQAERNLKKAEQFSNAIANELVKFQLERTKALLQWSQSKISEASHSLIQLTGWYKDYISENFAAMTEYEREGVL
ncbi:MAG: hypothetical protein GY816_09125 [Cytophagales bacterium]|nr:hypothetical protein [Cytophagales bacterium]